MNQGEKNTPTAAELTHLLRQSKSDGAAQDKIYEYVYADLRRLAQAQVRGGAHSPTLSATALVHEAYLKLSRQTNGAWSDRRHFFRTAAQAMRQIAVDHARMKLSKKRSAGNPVESVQDQASEPDQEAAMVLAIQEALDTLQQQDERLVRIVECRFFAGLTEQETAGALKLSVRTVEREWRRAKEWLKLKLG